MIWKELSRYESGTLIGVRLQDEEGWYSAYVKWDGCISFSRYFNMPVGLMNDEEKEENTDNMHICDIDEMIQILQELKEAALERFGTDWPRL